VLVTRGVAVDARSGVPLAVGVTVGVPGPLVAAGESVVAGVSERVAMAVKVWSGVTVSVAVAKSVGVNVGVGGRVATSVPGDDSGVGVNCPAAGVIDRGVVTLGGRIAGPPTPEPPEASTMGFGWMICSASKYQAVSGGGRLPHPNGPS